MKLMIYGGCHADAMTRSIRRYGRSGVEAKTFTNFTMIERGEPFPYEEAATFDAILLSPILNKGDYNTVFVEQFAAAKNIPVVKYPWIQWNGYFPGHQNMRLGWHKTWWNMALREEATRHATFDSFEAAVCEGDALTDLAIANRDASTERLRSGEDGSGVDIRIADWIEEHHREQRLMTTPDHAATPVYQHIMRQVEALLGKLVEPSFYHATAEIQAGLVAPIIPSVSRALGLRFASGDYQDPMVVKGAWLSLREYLQIQYDAPGIVEMTPCVDMTRLKLGDEAVGVKSGERFLAVREPSDVRQHSAYRLITGHYNPRAGVRALIGKTVLAFKSHWSVRDLWPHDLRDLLDLKVQHPADDTAARPGDGDSQPV